MTPTLFSLFKRGRYYRTIQQADEVDTATTREERERFLCAAIAFCIKHAPDEFGRHFFDRICKQHTDPDFDHVEVYFEQQDLDLVIVNHTPVGKFVYVIEAKAGATLKDHQNPEKAKFWDDPIGYGRTIKTTFGTADAIRFTVLGHEERLSPQKAPKGWIFSQRSWGDLLNLYPASPLAKDLEDLFTKLGVEAFMLKETEHLRVETDLEGAVDAYRVLTDTCAAFRLQKKYYSVGSGRDDDGPWFFGIDLLPVEFKGDVLGNQKNLTELVQPTGGTPVCWFGYQAKGKRSVWFYCGNDDAANGVIAKLGETKLVTTQPAGSHYVVVSNELNNSSASDRIWFTRVFEAVGMKKPL